MTLQTQAMTAHAAEQEQEPASTTRAADGEAGPSVEGELNQGQLVPSVSVDRLVAMRTKALETAREGFALLVAADKLLTDTGVGSVWHEMTSAMEGHRYSRYQEASDTDPSGKLTEGYAKLVDRAAWEHLMKASGLWSFMDHKARTEWRDALGNHSFPEFVPNNIDATFAVIHAARFDMMERGIVELFRRLSWDYKSNLPCLFGRKVVVRGVVGTFGSPAYGADSIEDLLRAMCKFDGKPEPDHRCGVRSAIYQSRSDRTNEHDFSYFRLRWFGNGNGHVMFQNQPMVDKLNAIIAKHYPAALPPARS